MKKTRYIMLVDIKRCIGCHTCALACKSGNNLPNHVWWNRVLTYGGDSMDTPYGTFPNLEMQFLTLACQHCEAPPCVDACPAEATFVREDGIVMQNYDDCLGCQACILACPYSNIRTYNEEKPHYYSEYPLGDDGVALQQKGTVSKCTLCHHRIDQGLEPNCIEVCPAKARYFGNAGDAESEVAQLLKERETIRFLEEKGTEPSIYYLV